MDRKLIWTEKASGDIEAIVRYIARRNPNAAARIGAGIYERAQILLQHPDAGSSWMNYVKKVGENSSSADGRSFTRSVKLPSSLVECGLRRWVKPIWKRRFNQMPSPPLNSAKGRGSNGALRSQHSASKHLVPDKMQTDHLR